MMPWYLNTALLTATLVFAALVFAGTAAADKATPIRLRGDIVSHTSATLTIHLRSGDTVTLDLGPNIPISAIRKMTLADIKPGSFIGAAARSDTQGKLFAQEVVVFPESARGTGEGHYAWDLSTQSSMTNATVDAVLQSPGGSDLRLSYKDGTTTVTVAPDVPVVTFVAAVADDLKAGKTVFAVTVVDGLNHYVAQRIVVEKDGVIPLM
jgi:hypothetical protein